MKAKKSYDKGGKTKKSNTTTSGIPGVGRPKTTRQGAPDKMKSIGPERSMQVEGIMSKMKAGAFSDSAKKLRAPGKPVAAVEKPRRKKRRRKFENGGKTNKDSVRTDTLERSEDQVYANARREEEERANSNRNNSGTTSGYRNVGRPLTTARPGAPAKVKPLGPKKIDSGASMNKTLKKSTAKISVPAEKKRKRRLRRRK